MFAWTVSILQIAAIIACPLWCGNGLCHAGQSCSAEQCSHQVCPVHRTACCCCDESSTDGDDDCPFQSPRNSSCQGVCGGAVFEKPSELNDGCNSYFVLPTDAESLLVVRLVKCNAHGLEQHWHCCGGNQGRFLRTLHMSWLC